MSSVRALIGLAEDAGDTELVERLRDLLDWLLPRTCPEDGDPCPESRRSPGDRGVSPSV